MTTAAKARELVEKAAPRRDQLKWIRDEIDQCIERDASYGKESTVFSMSMWCSAPTDVRILIDWLVEDGFEVDWPKNHPVLFGTIDIYWNKARTNS